MFSKDSLLKKDEYQCIISIQQTVKKVKPNSAKKKEGEAHGRGCVGLRNPLLPGRNQPKQEGFL